MLLRKFRKKKMLKIIVEEKMIRLKTAKNVPVYYSINRQ